MYILAGEKWDGAMDFCCQGGAIDSENYCAAQVSQVHEEYLRGPESQFEANFSGEILVVRKTHAKQRTPMTGDGFYIAPQMGMGFPWNGDG